MNFGDAEQHVRLKVAVPGQPVDLLSPQLKPMPLQHEGQPPETPPDLTNLPELRIDVERQFVSPEGEINCWIAPKGVRLVAVIRAEPR